MKKLWEYLATYLYLPRFRDSNVLLECVRDGIAKTTWQENFAYAERWDEVESRYVGLKAGQLGSIVIDSESLLVKPAVALGQLQADQQAVAEPTPPWEAPEQESLPEPAPQERKLRRFFGSAELDATRLARDAGVIANEVVQHLNALPKAKVRLSLEISATIPDGAPDNVVRTVTENCRTLKFDTQGFEEE